MKSTEFNDSQRERFLSYVEKKDNGCWDWTRSTAGNGNYGQCWLNNKVYSSHRVSYAMFNGDIPDGLFVRHTCDRSICVNPEHLVLGTNADNMQDARERGTGKVVTGIGEEHYNAKLTDDKVIELRRRVLAGESIADISSEWGVSPSTISRAALGKTWAHVPNPVPAYILETKGSRHGGTRKLDAKIEEQQRTGLKTCRSCKTKMPLSDFGKNKRMRDGLNALCKPCSRAQATEAYRRKSLIKNSNDIIVSQALA